MSRGPDRISMPLTDKANLQQRRTLQALLVLLSVAGIAAVDLCRARGSAAIPRARAAAHRRDGSMRISRRQRAYSGARQSGQDRIALFRAAAVVDSRIRSAAFGDRALGLAPDLTTVGWLPEVEPRARPKRCAALAASGVDAPAFRGAGWQTDRSGEARPAALSDHRYRAGRKPFRARRRCRLRSRTGCRPSATPRRRARSRAPGRCGSCRSPDVECAAALCADLRRERRLPRRDGFRLSGR